MGIASENVENETMMMFRGVAWGGIHFSKCSEGQGEPH